MAERYDGVGLQWLGITGACIALLLGAACSGSGDDGGEPSGAGQGGESGGAGGSSGTGASVDAGADAGDAPVDGVPANLLPAVEGTCPVLTTGSATINGTKVQLWVGTKPGPLWFYWHGTGVSYTEIDAGMPGVTAGIPTNGGIAASFDTTNAQGINTGNNVWYTGDFDTADQIVACGIQQGLVDTSRIYTSGYSAGGLQACAMVTYRGKYLTAALCSSGGAVIVSGTPMDTTHLPPVLLSHGAKGMDTFIIDFADASVTWENDYKAAGGFSIDCDDGGDHVGGFTTRPGLMGHAMQFFNDHTYGQMPYAAGLPADFPSYCKIVE